MGALRGLVAALLCVFLSGAQTQVQRNRLAGKFADRCILQYVWCSRLCLPVARYVFEYKNAMHDGSCKTCPNDRLLGSENEMLN